MQNGGDHQRMPRCATHNILNCKKSLISVSFRIHPPAIAAAHWQLGYARAIWSDGGRAWDRTTDPHGVNVVLYR
jgi:hypothetical protein